MIDFVKKYLPILIIILILGSYLGIKALNPDGWDGWGFGSAQVLMSSQYWAKDEFAKNYFLFIPQPYSKLAYYLDEPEFRNRPIETLGGELARNRLYYTHYPPLFLFPYAIMAKLGIESRAVFRIFSLLISLAAFFLFYLFIKLISTRTIAIIASIYYGFSVMFLNYADSIATQPFTIFFTFLILVLSILASRNYENQNALKKYNIAIWISYLALSLSSFDATIFIFVWLVLYEVLVLKKFPFRKWLFWASAPILGFALQVLQNTWYLGWHNMISDFCYIYTERTFRGVKNFIVGLTGPFVTMTSVKTFYFFKKTIATLGSAALIIGILWKLRTKLNLNHYFFKIIIILAVAATIQPFFVNATGGWPYQGVLTATFWGLLIGTSTMAVLEIFQQRKSLGQKERFLFGFLILITTALWTYQLSNTWSYVKEWPNNVPPKEVIEFSKAIQTFFPNQEKMAFRIYPKNQIWKSQFPTFSFEYYLEMPKVDFANTNDLLVDFWWFRNISEYPFYSFIIAENKSDAEKIRQELIMKKIKDISPIIDIQGQYIFTVGPK